MKRLSFRETETQRDPDLGGQTGDAQGVLLARLQTPGNVRLCLSPSCWYPAHMSRPIRVTHPEGRSRRDHYGARSSQRWAMVLCELGLQHAWGALLCFLF